jgi:hypothetical protein
MVIREYGNIREGSELSARYVTYEAGNVMILLHGYQGLSMNNVQGFFPFIHGNTGDS